MLIGLSRRSEPWLHKQVASARIYKTRRHAQPVRRIKLCRIPGMFSSRRIACSSLDWHNSEASRPRRGIALASRGGGASRTAICFVTSRLAFPPWMTQRSEGPVPSDRPPKSSLWRPARRTRETRAGYSTTIKTDFSWETRSARLIGNRTSGAVTPHVSPLHRALSIALLFCEPIETFTLSLSLELNMDYCALFGFQTDFIVLKRPSVSFPRMEHLFQWSNPFRTLDYHGRRQPALIIIWTLLFIGYFPGMHCDLRISIFQLSIS